MHLSRVLIVAATSLLASSDLIDASKCMVRPLRPLPPTDVKPYDPMIEANEPAIEVHPGIEMPDPSIDVPQPAIDVQPAINVQPAIEVPQPEIEVPQPAIEVNEPAIETSYSFGSSPPIPEPEIPKEQTTNPAETPEPPTPTKAPETTDVSTPSTATKSSKALSDNSKLCAKPRVRITEVDVGDVVDYNEDEAALKLVAIASLPSGGSRIAFHSGDNVIVRELDANDELVSSSAAVEVPLHDFADIYADKNGFVLLGTRDAEGGGTLNCGDPTNLCGTAPNPPVGCYDMYMVRYDGTKETWATKLTSSSASLPPYSTSKTGENVYMIWWYQHHGRIASDGTNWAAYFGAAISTSEGGCINVHQGDRMKVVNPSGTITADKESFDWGCSHSAYERITYDNRTQSYVMLCKTDSGNRIIPPNDWDSTIYPVDLAASNFGDIVPDSNPSSKKYWATVSNGNGDNAKVHLIHFAINAAASEDITLGGTDANERAPHLASIGNGGMLAMWEGSSAGGDLAEDGVRTMYVQVLDASTGKAISSKVTVDKSVVGNRFQALKTFPDGSVAYLSKGKKDTSLQIVRFFGC